MGELTHPQPKRLASLPDGHTVVGERGGSPPVERRDCRLESAGPNGRLAATTLVPNAQSYLCLKRY
jgi:hypothetical protein